MTAPAAAVSPPAYAPCGCTERAVTARDPERHAAWHAQVEEQGGPVGLVDLSTLREARKIRPPEFLPAETVTDRRAIASGKRASGARRRAAHGD